MIWVAVACSVLVLVSTGADIATCRGLRKKNRELEERLRRLERALS